MTKEPPVTPQELREIAGTSNAYWELPADEQIKLRALADWLSEHMLLYREAVELLEEMPRDLLDFAPTELEKRKRALLAKVKGE